MINVKQIFTMIVFTTIASLQLFATDVIDLNSVSGTWNSALNSEGGTPTNFSGGGTNFIHWGNPSRQQPNNSGYQFVGNAPPTVTGISVDTPFLLGSFTHFNFPITGNSLASVNLNISTMLNINNSPTQVNSTFQFLHNETPNIRTAQNPNCCNDIVTFLNNIQQSQIFNIGGIDYTVTLLGFSSVLNGPLLQQFSTIEGQANTAYLYAIITRADDLILAPEPSTYLILGALLLGAAYLNRRRLQAKG
jgi:hypothetical protein